MGKEILVTTPEPRFGSTVQNGVYSASNLPTAGYVCLSTRLLLCCQGHLADKHKKTTEKKLSYSVDWFIKVNPLICCIYLFLWFLSAALRSTLPWRSWQDTPAYSLCGVMEVGTNPHSQPTFLVCLARLTIWQLSAWFHIFLPSTEAISSLSLQYNERQLRQLVLTWCWRKWFGYDSKMLTLTAEWKVPGQNPDSMPFCVVSNVYSMPARRISCNFSSTVQPQTA